MSNKNAPADFFNPDSIAEELAAADVAAPVEKKAKKPAKPRVITITVPEGLKAGDTFEYEIPKSTGKRGQVAGIPLVEMTNDQLKIEYRNANSVFYKTKKAGKDFSKAETRLNAVKDEMEKRGIQPTSRGAAMKVDAATIANLIKGGKISIDDIQAFLDAQ